MARSELDFDVEAIIAREMLAESALLHAGRPRTQRSLAEAKRLVDRDLGIFAAHVEAYHASEHYIPF